MKAGGGGLSGGKHIVLNRKKYSSGFHKIKGNVQIALQSLNQKCLNCIGFINPSYKVKYKIFKDP